jgi:hypothetical protein
VMFNDAMSAAAGRLVDRKPIREARATQHAWSQGRAAAESSRDRAVHRAR